MQRKGAPTPVHLRVNKVRTGGLPAPRFAYADAVRLPLRVRTNSSRARRSRSSSVRTKVRNSFQLAPTWATVSGSRAAAQSTFVPRLLVWTRLCPLVLPDGGAIRSLRRSNAECSPRAASQGRAVAKSRPTELTPSSEPERPPAVDCGVSVPRRRSHLPRSIRYGGGRMPPRSATLRSSGTIPPSEARGRHDRIPDELDRKLSGRHKAHCQTLRNYDKPHLFDSSARTRTPRKATGGPRPAHQRAESYNPFCTPPIVGRRHCPSP